MQARVDSLTQAVKQLKQELARSKQAEALLHEREARLRAIFDHTAIGLAQLAPDGAFVEVNRALCDFFGYSAEELLHRSYFDLIPPDLLGEEREYWTKLFAGEAARAASEKPYLRRDGTIVWANLHLSVARADAGATQQLLAAFENVSGRKELEEALCRVAAALAQTAAAPAAVSWQWDIETGMVAGSPEFRRLFALEPPSAPARIGLLLDRVHPDDRPRVERALRQASEEQKPYRIEYRLRLPDGAEKLLLASGDVYSRDRQGKPRILIGMVQDITLRGQTGQALRAGEERFRLLFHNAVDGIIISGADCRCADANRSACRMLGYRREEMVGKHLADLLSPQDMQHFAETPPCLQQEEEHVEVFEWSMRHKDGYPIPVEVSARILPDGRWMGIVRDITDRRRVRSELEQYTEDMADLYDNAPCGYQVVDDDGVFVQVNRTALRWLGYAREELVGRKKVIDLMTGESREKFRASFPHFLKTGKVRDLEFDFIRSDGSILPTLLSASAAFDGQGRLARSRITLFDMTELAEAQRKLQQAATVFEHTNDAIIITHADGTIAAVNAAFSRITGYRPDEVIGKNPRLLKSERQDAAFYRNLWNDIEEHGTWQGEIWDRRKSGDVFPAWESITAVRDDSGKITDYISVFSDITTIKATEEKLVHLAYHDQLTGLPNRLLFNDRMQQALAHASRHRTRTALYFLDLDKFKQINDTLGHAAGDQLLQEVASRLKETIRKEDTVARLGGDEFAIVLAHLDSTDDAALLAQKIINLFSRPVDLAGQPMMISASIGIAIYPDDGEDLDELSRSADMAMYGAKSKGRNGYEFYTPEMTRAATEAVAANRALRRAVEQHELTLLYQPRISLSTGRIDGLEALIRWERSPAGLRSAGRLIQVAEESDLIEAIGDWVLDAACSQLLRWRQAGLPPVRVAVNLSARQLRRPALAAGLRKKLQDYGLDGGFGVDVEVSEAAMQASPDAAAALKELDSLGIRVAIDDFGTGYSCLTTLQQLPVSALKIDRSFIHGIPHHAGDNAIASAIVSLGHSLGMSVVAEGVETQDQLAFMQEQNCDDAQGFLFFPPLPPDECERLLMSPAPLDVLRHGTRGPA